MNIYDFSVKTRNGENISLSRFAPTVTPEEIDSKIAELL